MLKEAVTFLKGAIPRAGSAFYMFHDGYAYAQSPAILAAYPTPELQGTFGLDAKQLEAAVARFPKSPDISSNDDGDLVLKAGRLRTTLTPVFVDPPDTPTDIEWRPAPQGFVDALRTILPFLPKEGTWQRGVRLYGNTLMALNQRTAIEVTLDGLAATSYALLSNEFVNFLPSNPDLIAQQDGAFLCRWENGAWIKAQLMNFEWPASADRIMEFAGDVAPVTITEEWREAFKDAQALSDGQLQIEPRGIIAKQNSMKIDVEFETNVTKESRWVAEVLEPMFKVADRWNPDGDTAARFYGKNLRGVVSKLR